MTALKWRGQETILEATGGNLPAEPFGVLQEVTIAPDVNREELTGAGDTRFVDVMETARAFDITGSVMAWDPETWDRAIEWDEAAGETDGSADVERFTPTVTFTDSDGDQKIVEFADSYFNPPPEIGGGREEWMGMDINLRAPDVSSITNPGDA